jgi:hypothetical protein
MLVGRTLPPEVLDAPVQGLRLAPGRLRDQLGPEATLFVFLRHFGCIFCRETVEDLRRASEGTRDAVPVLFFAQATVDEARAFFEAHWPQARVVADPSGTFYAAFHVGRGTLRELFGPGIASRAREAQTKGIRQGPRGQDPWRMPGLFVVEGGAIVGQHQFRHAGDHPDFGRWLAAGRGIKA